MTAADELRALSAAATEGPWVKPYPSRPWIDTPVPVDVDEANWGGDNLTRMTLVMFEDDGAWKNADAELIVWCRNHADALANLIDAAQDVDANVDPAVTGNALRDALAALEADQ